MQSKNTGFIVTVTLSVPYLITPAVDADCMGDITENKNLLLGPIEGLTTGWHVAPIDFALPADTEEVWLKHKANPKDQVVWSGAEEMDRTATYSLARCRPDSDDIPVCVEIVRPSGTTSRSGCQIKMSHLRLEDIRIETLRLSAEPFDVQPSAPNLITMDYFFQSSIAPLVQTDVDSYRTSINTEVILAAPVTPSVFAPLVEFRVDGKPQYLGTPVIPEINKIGEYHFAAGAADSGLEAHLETYEVIIVDHTPGGKIVPDGVQITYTARTEPRGFENEINWLSSTKYGTAHPTIGRGSRFAVVFNDTWGMLYGDTPFRWLGVRANNADFNLDQKISNDAFENATVIDSVPFSDTEIAIAKANDDDNVDPPCDDVLGCNGAPANNGVWYEYTPTKDCTALINREGPNDTVVSVWTGASRDELMTETCRDNESTSIPLSAGTTYYLLVSDFSCTEEPEDMMNFIFDCVSQECGNGTREGSETCDGADLGVCQFGCDPDCTCTTQPPPPNDECGSCATALTGVPVFGQTESATGKDESECALNDSPDAWHCWTADCTGWATFSLCGDGTDFDSTLSVFDGCGGVEIVCNDDSDDCDKSRSKSSIAVKEGIDYRIRVSGFNGASGEYELMVTCEQAQCSNNLTEGEEECDGTSDSLCPGRCQPDCTCGGPVNDACANAIDVGGLPALITADNQFANDEDPDVCGTLIGHAGVWYSADGTGNTMTASTCGGTTSFDSRIHVFCGDCAAPFCAGADDDGCGIEGAGSSVSWCSEVGTTYYILITGVDSSDQGVFSLTVNDDGVSCESPPACQESPDPTGACCIDLSMGECLDDLTIGACRDIGGAYGGEGTTCLSLDCSTLKRCFYDLSSTEPCSGPCGGGKSCPVSGNVFYGVGCDDASSCPIEIERSVRCDNAAADCCCTGTFTLVPDLINQCLQAKANDVAAPKNFCPERFTTECDFSRTQNTPFVIPPTAAENRTPREDDRPVFQELKPNEAWEKCLWFEANIANIKVELDPTMCMCDPNCNGMITATITVTIAGLTGSAGQNFSILCDALSDGEFTKKDGKRFKTRMGVIEQTDTATAVEFMIVPGTNPIQASAMLTKSFPCTDMEKLIRLSILPKKVVDLVNAIGPGATVSPGDGRNPNLGRPGFIDIRITNEKCGEVLMVPDIFFMNFATLKDELQWFEALTSHTDGNNMNNIAAALASVPKVESDAKNSNRETIPACQARTVFRKIDGDNSYPEKGASHIDPISSCDALLKFVRLVDPSGTNNSLKAQIMSLDSDTPMLEQSLCAMLQNATAAAQEAQRLKGAVLIDANSVQGQRDKACSAAVKAKAFKEAVNEAKAVVMNPEDPDDVGRALEAAQTAGCELDAAAYDLLIGTDAIYPWSKFIADLKDCLQMQGN